MTENTEIPAIATSAVSLPSAVVLVVWLCYSLSNGCDDALIQFVTKPAKEKYLKKARQKLKLSRSWQI